MTFAWPFVLLLLVLPAGAVAAEWLSRRSQRRDARTLDYPNILRAEAGPADLQLSARRVRPRRPGPWLAAAAALAIVALARPQWGREAEPMFDRSREILIAVDLSRSMLTPDVAPSRLERSKLLIHSLLDRLDGDRVGLVVFTGTAFLQAPLSADYEILREFLPQLGPEFLPDAGTNYGPMLETAAAAFSRNSDADRFLIVLSDGGANDEDWQSRIPALIKQGVHVIALGVGTAAGGFIPDGHGGLVKDDRGAVVLAKLEAESLKQLADRTHGLYRDASDWVDIPRLVQGVIAAGKQGAFAELKSVRRIERFQWALGPALLLFCLSFCRELPVRPKPRPLRWAAAAGLLLALGLRAGLTAALPPQQLLGRIVGRLAAAPLPPAAQDWAELASQTVTWGQAFAGAQQAVPPGPVHDALEAVQRGRAQEAKAADWAKLQRDLETLLQPPPKPKPNPDQQKQQQQQDQKPPQKPQGGGSSSDQNKPEEQKQQEERQKQQSQNSGSSGRSDPVQKPKDPSTSQEPQPQALAGQKPDTQPVGGQPQSARPDPARLDPALAGSLQKLDRVRDEDSPAQLFQMLASQNPQPKPPPPQHPKNW